MSDFRRERFRTDVRARQEPRFVYHLDRTCRRKRLLYRLHVQLVRGRHKAEG